MKIYNKKILIIKNKTYKVIKIFHKQKINKFNIKKNRTKIVKIIKIQIFLIKIYKMIKKLIKLV